MYFNCYVGSLQGSEKFHAKFSGLRFCKAFIYVKKIHGQSKEAPKMYKICINNKKTRINC